MICFSVTTIVHETRSPCATLLNENRPNKAHHSRRREEKEAIELGDSSNQTCFIQDKSRYGLVKLKCRKKFVLYACAPIAFFMVFVIPFAILLGVSFEPCSTQSFFTDPGVVFVSRFDTWCNKTVQFNKISSVGKTVTFYPAPCSAITLRRVRDTYAGQVHFESDEREFSVRGLREIYLVDGSNISYTFSATSNALPNLVDVIVFQDYTGYRNLTSYVSYEPTVVYTIRPNSTICYFHSVSRRRSKLLHRCSHSTSYNISQLHCD